MNKIDFTQPGGFPLDQDVFGFQQENINMAMQPVSLAGQFAILSGCTIGGGLASNGYVAINGEVLPFIGGNIEAKVRIVEQATSLNYEDGTPRPSQINRHVRFGDDGVTILQWSDFKRNTSEGVLARLERLEWLTAPDKAGGSMRFWNKPANVPLPDGWQEAVSMRDWIPMGAKPGTTGKEVGNTTSLDDYKLTEAHLPEFEFEVEIPSRDLSNAGNFGPDLSADGEGDNRTFTGSAGNANPDTLPLPPVKYIMFIEPIPNYID